MTRTARRWIVGLAQLLLIPACAGGSGSESAVPEEALAQIAPAEQQPADQPVLGTGQPPFVQIVSPGSGSTAFEGATINVQAAAISPDTIVVLADLLDNGRRVASRTAAPFIFPLGGLAEGTHVLTVVAVDVQGLTGVSNPVTIFVIGR
jgi:hypothetical protein